MRCTFRMFALIFLSVTAVICRADEMLRISRMVMADQVVSAPALVYPEDAKAAGVEGMVVLDVVISTTGAVEQAVAMSGPEQLRDAAKDAVSKWTYRPYLLDGVATEVDTTVWIDFSLKGGARNASADATAATPAMTIADSRVAAPATSATTTGQPGAAPPVSTQSAAPERRTVPVRVSGGVMQGLLLKKVQPVYPEEAIHTHASGTVVIHAIISKTGYLERLEVISGDSMFRQAALDAVKGWVYKPYTLLGQQVEVDTQISVNFRYGNGPQPMPDASQSRPGVQPGQPRQPNLPGMPH